jgi:dTDP-4-amino-4,6-dideoxygalactose transaminase
MRKSRRGRFSCAIFAIHAGGRKSHGNRTEALLTGVNCNFKELKQAAALKDLPQIKNENADKTAILHMLRQHYGNHGNTTQKPPQKLCKKLEAIFVKNFRPYD